MTLTLAQLAGLLPDAELIGPGDVELRGVTEDSRRVEPGFAFVAVRGEKLDGHDFIGQAVANGASAVIAQRRTGDLNGTPLVLVRDSRVALTQSAAAVCDWPGRKLRGIAVTGTNGKSTTAFMVRTILSAAGHSTGLLGTIRYHVGARIIPASMTTPGPVELQRMLAMMVESGAEFCVLEASSHSLDQHRVDNIHFGAAIFTNITPHEHLDYHRTFDHYLRSKVRLFEGLPRDATAAINVDDPNAAAFVTASRCNVLRYGLSDAADVRGRLIRASINGTTFEVTTPKGSATISGCFVGMHNLYNALGSIAATVGMGIDLADIAQGLAHFAGVPGRLEAVDCGQDFSLFVDYAHTDDAMRAVLSALRSLLTGRLIVVFGCGGDRDRSKRPRMGAVAQRLADFSILTADNSRSERTEDILGEIRGGFTDRMCYEICPDRRLAIRRAIEMARPGDTVVIAGKGHETTQTINGVTHEFDDREIARCWLRKRIEEETIDDIDRAGRSA
jgi:UDP-N-acetylmuramoyl-L-alanyl-D-glutamate--2,6-diaminopimelate ligase